MPYKTKTCRKCDSEFEPHGGRQLDCDPCRGKPAQPRGLPANYNLPRQPHEAEPTAARPTRRPRPKLPPELIDRFLEAIGEDLGDLSPSELGGRFLDVGRAMRRRDPDDVAAALLAAAAGALVVAADPGRIAMPPSPWPGRWPPS